MEDVLLLTEAEISDLRLGGKIRDGEITFICQKDASRYITESGYVNENGMVIVQTARGLYGTETKLPFRFFMRDSERNVIFKPVKVRTTYYYELVDRAISDDTPVYERYYSEEEG